jgi:hypothetical protein
MKTKPAQASTLHGIQQCIVNLLKNNKDGLTFKEITMMIPFWSAEQLKRYFYPLVKENIIGKKPISKAHLKRIYRYYPGSGKLPVFIYFVRDHGNT